MSRHRDVEPAKNATSTGLAGLDTSMNEVPVVVPTMAMAVSPDS